MIILLSYFHIFLTCRSKTKLWRRYYICIYEYYNNYNIKFDIFHVNCFAGINTPELR